MKSDLKILLFEDSPEDFLLLENALESDALHRISLTRAERLQDGLKLLRHGKFDAILLDLDLPDSHGLKTFEQVVEQAGEIPIVICSGNTDESDAITAVRNGAQDYIVKGTFGYALAPRTIRYAVERNLGQHQLRASEKYWRTLIDQNNDAIALVDAEGTILYESSSVLRVLGYAPEELIGHNGLELLHPEDREIAARSFADILNRPGEPVVIVTRCIHKSGETRWIEATNTNWLEDPDLNAIIINFRDITERKQIEIKLEESQSRLKGVIDSAMDAIISANGDLKVVLFNETAERMFGIPAQEALGQPLSRFIPERYKTLHNQHMDGVSEGFIRGIPAGHVFPILGKRSNGEEFPAESSISYVETHDEKLYTAILRDVTERKKSERALRESEEFLKFSQKIANMGSWRLDLSTYKVDWSENCYSLYGYEPYEVEPSLDLFKQAVHPEDLPFIENTINDVLQNPRDMNYELRIVDKNGHIKWIYNSMTPVFENGQVAQFVGIQIDITGRKQAEENLRESEQKYRDLINGMSETVWVVDFDMSILDVNQAASNLLGYSRAELLSMKLPEIDAHLLPEQILHLLNTIARDDIQVFETYHRTKDGRQIPIEISAIQATYQDKTAIICIARNIIKRKKTEALIYAQRDLARSIGTFTTIEAGLQVVLDTVLELAELDSGGIYLFSRDSRTMDLIQHKGLKPEFVEAASSYPIDSINVQMILQGNPVYISSKDPVVQNPLHIAEGLRALAVVPVLYEKRVIGCLNIASHTLDEIPQSARQILETLAVEIGNVVLYLQSQAALRASEENFRQIAETINEAFWIFDNEQQKLVYLNQSYEKIWGVSIEETYQDNRKYIQAIHPDDRQIMLAAFERQTQGMRTQMEYRILQPDGSIRWIYDRSFPIMGTDGRILRTTGVAADITERKRAEEALKNRMQDLALTNKLNAAVNQGEDLVAIINLLSKEVNAIFGGLSASIYLLDQDKKHLNMRHFTMQAEMVTKLEKMIGRSAPQISIPIGGDDHYNLVLNSSQGFLISGFDGICNWLSDFANTTFLSDRSRYVVRKFVPAVARLLNINSVISIPLKIGTDVLGLVEFASESEFDESVLERLQNTRHQLSEVIARMQVEQSLRESNEKFRLLSEELEERVRQRTAEVQDLYDNAPTGYHSLDANGRFLQINQTELNWLGYTRDELIGRPIQEILSPAGLETFRRNFPVFKQTGQLRDTELEFICKDGTVLPGLVNAIAIYDGNGNYVMSRSTLFDNTERKKAEQALLESRENLQYFFDTASDLIQSIDETGRYLYVNAAWSKTLGYTAEEASRLQMLDVIDPSHHEHCRAMLRSLIIDQHPQQLEVIFRTKQGQEVIVEGSVSSRKDKTGHIATNGIFRNITERKRAEEALRQSEATYRALFESTNDAIFLIDMNNKIVRSNSRAPELLGYDYAEDFLGQDADRFVDPSQSIDAEERMTQLIQIGRLPLYERKFVRKNGEKIDTEINLSLIKDIKGQPMLIQSVVRDISQRKAVEHTLLLANTELERALRMKDEFLANMSHELRTPLNAILGLSDSLFEETAGPINEKQGHYLITINESGKHLLNLINDILDLAKIESGQISLELQNVRIQEVCQASMRMVKQLAQKKNQTINLDLSAEVDLVRVDERRLKQMIVNLLSNAIKFTPEYGKLGVEVKADPSHASVSITVWDQGIGIAETDIQRLFQPFVQLDSSLSRESSGTGLGLALVAEMARLHGGSVSVESKVGHGSRFTIHLPWSEALSVEPEPVKKSTGRLVEKFGRQKNKVYTILIVEDTEHVLMMLGDYLTQNGYNVAVANNGLEGLEKARSLTPDLILMDVQMPGMDGLEATRRIRQEAGLVKTPIIALTALAMQSDRDRCMEAGMTDYISKPVNLKNLVNTIQKYISDPVIEKEIRRTS